MIFSKVYQYAISHETPVSINLAVLSFKQPDHFFRNLTIKNTIVGNFVS